MQARMKNPAVMLPDVMQALQALNQATRNCGIPATTMEMVALRASQINGCSVCIDGHPRIMRKLGESEDRIASVVAWRHTPYFTDAERAALALTEALTRLSDREDAVPDTVWAEAKRYYDEKALAGLIVAIANINVWNRLNVAVAQVAGEWKP